MNENIQELEVHIKVLRVGSKQLTKSLLKQLPHKDILGTIHPKDLLEGGNTHGRFKGAELGKIWGYVVLNQFEPFDETYFVWELDNILYIQCATDACLTELDLRYFIDNLSLDQLFIGV